MKTQKKKADPKTSNSHGCSFGVILLTGLCVFLQMPQSRGMDKSPASLEPIDLLELSLSNLSAITAETSATAQKLQKQKEAETEKEAPHSCQAVANVNQVNAEEDGPQDIVTLRKDIDKDVPALPAVGLSDPFAPYPLFAIDTPNLSTPEPVAESAPAEAAPECLTAKAGLPEPEAEMQVWANRIAAPKSDGYEQMKLELQKVIYQVRSIELEAKQAKAVSKAATDSMQRADANGMESDANNDRAMAQQDKPQQIRLPYEPVSERTLKALEDFAKTAGAEGAELQNALELAEILYRSGCLEQAATVYRLAFQAASTDSKASAEDKAWILLQMGNCLKDTNAAQALEAYKQLVTEYPNSMWKDMAKTQLELLNWYASDKPGELIAKNAMVSQNQLKAEQQ